MADGALRIGLVGYSFMGQAHTHAWESVGRFFDLPLVPRRTALCGRTEEAAEQAAARLGWESVETDWRDLVGRDDIDVVDICTPGSSHPEIAVAALEAGKHVLCEKPLANTVEEAERMATAARTAADRGVRAMVGFNYRRVPAAAFARQLIADGRLGEVRHVRARYLQDFIIDPQFPLIWRLREEEAGSGALGDIGAHIIDLSQHLLGDRLASVSALTETFITERPLPGHAAGLAAGSDEAAETGQVTVDDAALFLGRFSSGAVGTFEATRFATGHKNGLTVEVNGSRGSLVFDLERLNELQVYETEGPASEQGFRTILVTEEDHPYVQAWWPPGHMLGWEHSFTHEVHDFVHAIADGRSPEPDFDDGLQVQRVLHAVSRSARSGAWTDVRGGGSER